MPSCYRCLQVGHKGLTNSERQAARNLADRSVSGCPYDFAPATSPTIPPALATVDLSDPGI